MGIQGSRALALVAVRRAFAVTAALALACVLVPPGRADAAIPSPAVPIDITASGSNGSGRITTPGRACADGGRGAHWHYDYESVLGRGVFSGLESVARLHVDLHSDDDAPVVDPPADPPFEGTGSDAFLQGDESHLTISNARGAVKLRMRAGDCTDPTVAFDGDHADGSGLWTVDRGTGAYRDVTGAGSFVLGADVTPGADNDFDVQLSGQMDIPRPGLGAAVADVYWGFLGADYLLRRVTVVYRVTNTGSGDAFGARVVAASSPTDGVTVIGAPSRPLGDLKAGESELVTFRYQLGLTKPCLLTVLGCTFDTKLQVDLPDALDRSQIDEKTLRVRAPSLPPPL